MPLTRKRMLRPPQQRRSKAAWQRILDAGMSILKEHGRQALTVKAICKRARVAPPAIYARVDGISGLFWAIHDTGFKKVIATKNRLLAKAALTEPGSDARIREVVEAMCETFRRHDRFLHDLINIAVTDTPLRARGSFESLAFIDEIVGLLPEEPPGAAVAVARMVQQECVFRAIFGNQWTSRRPELAAPFRQRLTHMALGRFGRLQ